MLLHKWLNIASRTNLCSNFYSTFSLLPNPPHLTTSATQRPPHTVSSSKMGVAEQVPHPHLLGRFLFLLSAPPLAVSFRNTTLPNPQHPISSACSHPPHTTPITFSDTTSNAHDQQFRMFGTTVPGTCPSASTNTRGQRQKHHTPRPHTPNAFSLLLTPPHPTPSAAQQPLHTQYFQPAPNPPTPHTFSLHPTPPHPTRPQQGHGRRAKQGGRRGKERAREREKNRASERARERERERERERARAPESERERARERERESEEEATFARRSSAVGPPFMAL